MGFYLIVSLFLLLPFFVRDARIFLTCTRTLAALLLPLAPQDQFYPLDLWPQFGLGIVI